MEITFPCPSCCNDVLAPSEYVGRDIRCLACSSRLIVPSREQARDLRQARRAKIVAEEVAAAESRAALCTAEAKLVASSAVNSAEPSAIKACPFCAEEIHAAAKKCKHCGEFLDAKEKRAQQFNPGLARVLSLVIPGAGQVYRGDIAQGIGLFICTIAGYMMFVVPGIIVHIAVINDAGSAD